MQNLVRAVAGAFAIVFGGTILLFLLPWASIQHPQFQGTDYWLAVAGKIFGRAAIEPTVLGLCLVFGGVAASLQPAFADLEHRTAAIWYWGSVAVAFVGLVCLLLAINFVLP